MKADTLCRLYSYAFLGDRYSDAGCSDAECEGFAEALNCLRDIRAIQIRRGWKLWTKIKSSVFIKNIKKKVWCLLFKRFIIQSANFVCHIFVNNSVNFPLSNPTFLRHTIRKWFSLIYGIIFFFWNKHAEKDGCNESRPIFLIYMLC